MKRSDFAYILSCTFAAMTSLFYCSIRWFHIKLPRYYPLEHTWKWTKDQGVPSQGWYAMQVFAYLGAAIVTIMVFLLLKTIIKKDNLLKPIAAKYIGAAAAIIMICCMTYIVWYEFRHWGIL
jgi:hypothetical protein